MTRRTVFELADSIGLKVLEKQIDIKEVEDADEAFFSGTASEVTPICSVDDNIIGNGLPGQLTIKLQNIYMDIVRGNNKFSDNWLTMV